MEDAALVPVDMSDIDEADVIREAVMMLGFSPFSTAAVNPLGIMIMLLSLLSLSIFA